MQNREKINIYLAAPLFSQGEQDFNLKVYEYLKENDYQVFLPQNECKEKEGKDIYKTCLFGLQSSQIVVAILDGADADSGTSWECGFAVSQNIPVIAVRTDFRLSGDTQGFNAMLYYSATTVIDNSDNILEKILHSLKALEI